MVLSQQWSVLMSTAPVTNKGNKDKTAQSWPCPLLAAAIGIIGSAPHLLLHLERNPSNLPGQHSRADPVDRGTGDLAS